GARARRATGADARGRRPQHRARRREPRRRRADRIPRGEARHLDRERSPTHARRGLPGPHRPPHDRRQRGSALMVTVIDRQIAPRPTLRDTIEQTKAMAWRALLKMRRNPEQFFDVTLQPLLFTAMFTYIFGGAVAGSTASYLPIIIPGILAQTTLTACMATGI